MIDGVRPSTVARHFKPAGLQLETPLSESTTEKVTVVTPAMPTLVKAGKAELLSPTYKFPYHIVLDNLLSKLHTEYEYVNFLSIKSVKTYTQMINEIINNPESWGGETAFSELGSKIVEMIQQEVVSMNAADLAQWGQAKRKFYSDNIAIDKHVSDEINVMTKVPTKIDIVFHKALETLGITNFSPRSITPYEKNIFILRAKRFHDYKADDIKIRDKFRKEAMEAYTHYRTFVKSIEMLKVPNLHYAELSTEDIDNYINLANQMKNNSQNTPLPTNEVVLSHAYKTDMSHAELATPTGSKSRRPAPKQRKYASIVVPPHVSRDTRIKKAIPARRNDSGVCPRPFKQSFATKELAIEFINLKHSDDDKIEPYRCKCGAIHIGHPIPGQKGL